MPGERVRKLARENPEAFRNVAEMADDELGKILLETLDEET